jgi:Na+-transporting NADH:ubiquinone oxidoreductase subunit NqrB
MRECQENFSFSLLYRLTIVSILILIFYFYFCVHVSIAHHRKPLWYFQCLYFIICNKSRYPSIVCKPL